RQELAVDSGPVRYLAALIGQDDEKVMHWFVLAVALLLDPLAVSLLLAASASGNRAPARGAIKQTPNARRDFFDLNQDHAFASELSSNIGANDLLPHRAAA